MSYAGLPQLEHAGGQVAPTAAAYYQYPHYPQAPTAVPHHHAATTPAAAQYYTPPTAAVAVPQHYPPAATAAPPHYWPQQQQQQPQPPQQAAEVNWPLPSYNVPRSQPLLPYAAQQSGSLPLPPHSAGNPMCNICGGGDHASTPQAEAAARLTGLPAASLGLVASYQLHRPDEEKDVLVGAHSECLDRLGGHVMDEGPTDESHAALPALVVEADQALAARLEPGFACGACRQKGGPIVCRSCEVQYHDACAARALIAGGNSALLHRLWGPEAFECQPCLQARQPTVRPPSPARQSWNANPIPATERRQEVRPPTTDDYRHNGQQRRGSDAARAPQPTRHHDRDDRYDDRRDDRRTAASLLPLPYEHQKQPQPGLLPHPHHQQQPQPHSQQQSHYPPSYPSTNQRPADSRDDGRGEPARQWGSTQPHASDSRDGTRRPSSPPRQYQASATTPAYRRTSRERSPTRRRADSPPRSYERPRDARDDRPRDDRPRDDWPRDDRSRDYAPSSSSSSSKLAHDDRRDRRAPSPLPPARRRSRSRSPLRHSTTTSVRPRSPRREISRRAPSPPPRRALSPPRRASSPQRPAPSRTEYRERVRSRSRDRHYQREPSPPRSRREVTRPRSPPRSTRSPPRTSHHSTRSPPRASYSSHSDARSTRVAVTRSRSRSPHRRRSDSPPGLLFSPPPPHRPRTPPRHRSRTPPRSSRTGVAGEFSTSNGLRIAVRQKTIVIKTREEQQQRAQPVSYDRSPDVRMRDTDRRPSDDRRAAPAELPPFITTRGATWACTICSCTLPSLSVVAGHVKGKAHRMKVHGPPPSFAPKSTPPTNQSSPPSEPVRFTTSRAEVDAASAFTPLPPDSPRRRSRSRSWSRDQLADAEPADDLAVVASSPAAPRSPADSTMVDAELE